MYFRRTGPLDDRRRRVLSDPLLASALGLGSRSTRYRRSSGRQVRLLRSENYGDAEFLEDQVRLIDLIPLRGYTVFLVFAAGVLAVAGLLVLHAWMPRFAAWLPSGRLAAFDLDNPRSLGTWFSTLVLAAAAFAAVLVFSVRRYKIDDYHGHYHVWLWASLCWLYMSIEQTTCLRDAIADLLIAVTGARLFADGAAWWMILYGFLIGGVAMRLLIDMRSCTSSSTALVAAAACYVVVVLAQFGLVQDLFWGEPAALRHGAVMFGNLLVFMAMLLHGRHVILDALGLLPRSEAPTELLRRGAQIAEAAQLLTACSRAVKVHPPHSVPRPAPSTSSGTPQQVTVVVAPTPQGSKPSAATPAAASDFIPSVARKLTKEERKRLRERLERERRQREALG
jgi:hypothetical protein